ncbi:4-vinyl reductase [Reichenbachiella versicolor]|uniref:4-vinyl reductase n=1 Tax=Reichenbachiella versicolor TaxID=1821036 RepID=UPI000D6E1848|nr:4-vinyl reductase [Reichenbachiella versicolor]
MKKIGSYLSDKNVYEFHEEPLFYQSEYFNVYFQKAVEEFRNHLDLNNILVTSAQEVVYSQLSKYFKSMSKGDIDDRKRAVENYFQSCGFGKIDLQPIQAKGGYIIAENEHYAQAWLKHFGKRTEHESGVSYFTLGFLAGAVEAIFDTQPGVFTGIQLSCISKGDSECKFEIYRGLKRKINASPSFGKENTAEFNELKVNPVLHAIEDLNLDGRKSDDGLIHEFDTTLTRHYVNYFALVSIKLLMLSNKKIGGAGFKKAKEAIFKTAQDNLYFTAGKVMNSEKWSELMAVRPELGGQSHLKNVVDLQTAFGLGHWDLQGNDSKNVEIKIYNSPITNAYLKLVGNTKAAIGYYQGGVVSAIGNLMTKGFATDGDVDLNYVDKYSKDNDFQYTEKQSRMTGHDLDLINATNDY